ncbi:hypothetical protein [Bacillus rubiinfantis]|uniref:hypothetical protein n=1 Tax=Bacillus rubiinfantis TaxID=1499680 RepID=UPI0005A9A263|nr:hypothetical protein [Bacillus rubiinfantis]
MLKVAVFILIAVTLVLLSMFVSGLMELYKKEQEEAKNTIRDGMEGYLDQTFGFGKVKMFKTLYDADGTIRYLVYLPKYEWFKTPEFKWYEVYSTEGGFQHAEIQQ